MEFDTNARKHQSFIASSLVLSAMQVKTLPETPAQAMPALETTEEKQEDMLACPLDATLTVPYGRSRSIKTGSC